MFSVHFFHDIANSNANCGFVYVDINPQFAFLLCHNALLVVNLHYYFVIPIENIKSYCLCLFASVVLLCA